MGGVAWTLFWVAALAALVSSTVTRSKRKINPNSDDTDTLETSTSQSTDAVSGKYRTPTTLTVPLVVCRNGQFLSSCFVLIHLLHSYQFDPFL